MAARTPITVRNLYRSILGRVSGYRANRIIVVQGTIVGLPEAPLNELGFRNLLYKARDVASDGKPALRVHVSAGDTTSAYTPKEATLNTQRYLNSTFVNVEKSDGDVVTCLHIVAVDGGIASQVYCPQVRGEFYLLNDPNDVYLQLTMNDATDIESIIVGDYELTEGQHYDYDITEGYIIIYNINYLVGAFEGAGHGDTVEFVIQFDICDPVTAVVSALDLSEDEDTDVS